MRLRDRWLSESAELQGGLIERGTAIFLPEVEDAAG